MVLILKGKKEGCRESVDIGEYIHVHVPSLHRTLLDVGRILVKEIAAVTRAKARGGH